MKYLKEFASASDANTQGAAGLSAPRVSIINGKSAVNIYNASGASAFTCTFNEDGSIVIPTPTVEGWKIYEVLQNYSIVGTPYGAFYDIFGAIGETVQVNSAETQITGNMFGDTMVFKNDKILYSLSDSPSSGSPMFLIYDKETQKKWYKLLHC